MPAPIATFLSANAKDVLAFDFIALPGLAGQMEKAATTSTTDKVETTTTTTLNPSAGSETLRRDLVLEPVAAARPRSPGPVL